MTGDQTDMRQRLRLTLPARWFGDVAPVLDGILSGFAAGWASLYDLLQFVILQSRITTATDNFLESAAADFLSDAFPRRQNEHDTSYRGRLLLALRRRRATRPAIIDAAAAAGFSVAVFEPAQPASTGAYNVPLGLAWSSCGGWGSMEMPFESLIVATPTSESVESDLWQNLGNATPAGGALWLRIKPPA